jgi:hypothetical protein
LGSCVCDSLFAVHPAIAETINYIVQRAELYSTLGVVVLWIYWPRLRTYGLYLLPLVAAMLSKPPAVVFPLLLFLYTWLVDGEQPKVALRRSAPSILAAAGMIWLVSATTPKSFSPGAVSAYSYWITQPIVVFRYFRTFFIPTGLTADTDRVPFVSIFNGEALPGFAYVLGLAYLVSLLVQDSI